MTIKNKNNIFRFYAFIGCVACIAGITSCGKQNVTSVPGLNIQYEVLNLSPDLGPIVLFVDYKQVSGRTSPYIFSVNQGYFYVPDVATTNPYQFRPFVPNGTVSTSLFTRSDTMRSGLKYTLFISGSYNGGGNNSTLIQTFTVDTAAVPGSGRGKIRFVDVSPTAAAGLDVYANGTKAFSNIPYKTVSKYIEIPNGNYDVQITATGKSAILKDMPAVSIQDGRLYTLYAYGYTSRVDSAAFNANIITNK